jgi:hypothetical protein
MIRLPSTTYTLQLILSAGTADVDVSYSDATTTGYTGGTQETAATATTQTICAAPAASTVRDIDFLSVKIKTTGGVVTVQKLNSSGAVVTQLISVTLLDEEELNYTHGSGWTALDAFGNRKEVTGSTFGALTATSITDTGLTSGRITYAGVGGLLQDSANLTYNGTTLTLSAAFSSSPAVTVTATGGASNAIFRLDSSAGNGYSSSIQYRSATTGGTVNEWAVGTGLTGGTNAFEFYDGTATRMSLVIGGGTTISSSTGLQPLTLDTTNASSRGANIAFAQNGSIRGYVGVSGYVLGTTASDMAMYADTGKTINLWANGQSTIGAQINSTGLAVTGTTTSSSTIKVNAGGLGILGTYPSDEANLLSVTAASGASTLAAHGSTTGSGNQGTYNFYVVDSAGNNPVLPLQLTYTGAAVTGALSATTQLTVTGTTNAQTIIATSATDNTGLSMVNTSTGGRTWRVLSTGGISGYGQGKWVLEDTTGGVAALTFTTASGLAVTGTLTTTGTANITGSASNYGLLVSGSATAGQAAYFDQKNTTATTSAVDVQHEATTGDNIFIKFFTEASPTQRGSISYNRAGGVVAYNTTSDYRSKDILGNLEGAGETIDQLRVYLGQMKGATIARPMMIAHEAQAVVPYAVTGTKDAVNDKGDPIYQSMDHQILVPLLIAEVQSLRSRVALLEA